MLKSVEPGMTINGIQLLHKDEVAMAAGAAEPYGREGLPR